MAHEPDPRDSKVTRRDVVIGAGAALSAVAATVTATPAAAQARDPDDRDHAPGGEPRPEIGAPILPYLPVETLGGATAPFRMVGEVKEIHLVAEEISHELAPGCVIKCWGYNGRTPGPTLELVEGDKVRVLVENKLGEATSIHWHGLLVPNGMDGVGGVTQPHIAPGETWAYELTLGQHGTFMYHPHVDETVQMAVGMMGMIVVHPKRPPPGPKVDRDYAVMLHEWAVHPGTYRPDPAVMLDFNVFTFNAKVFPAIPPLVVRTGQRVRLRLGNLSMDDHPIHMHGANFQVTGTDGGAVPDSARFPETTVLVPVGATRDLEWVARLPGDWPLHCHKSHHAMGAMGHQLPNPMGADQQKAARRLQKHLPGYMPMGEHGMAEHQALLSSASPDGSSQRAAHMPGPKNTLPMMAGRGPFGNIGMGGMFTLVKVRDGITSFADPGWYAQPAGSGARLVRGAAGGGD